MGEKSDSILLSVKHYIWGLAETYDVYDEVILENINGVFATLTQLGVGPEEGFVVTSAEDVWTDFLPEGPTLSLVKTFVEKKTKYLFDPPTSSALKDALERVLAEYEWRCYISCNSTQEGVL